MTDQLTALVALEKALEAGETSSSDMFLNAQLAFPTWEHLVMQVVSGKCMNAALELAGAVVPRWTISMYLYSGGPCEINAHTHSKKLRNVMVSSHNKIPAFALLLAIIAAKKLELQNG